MGVVRLWDDGGVAAVLGGGGTVLGGGGAVLGRGGMVLRWSCNGTTVVAEKQCDTAQDERGCQQW